MERVGDCMRGTRGVDCAFNAVLYFAVTAVVWILTALPLLAWADPSANKTARYSLLNVAVSALWCFLDGVLASTTVGYGHRSFWVSGSIHLVCGISAFSTKWCNVAAALSGLHAGDQGWGRLIIRTRRTYELMGLLHVLFAFMFFPYLYFYDYLDVVLQEASDTVVIVWGAWLVFGNLFVLSGLACVQCYIARVCLASVDGARSLQETALINLIQQLSIDLLIVIYAALYAADSKRDGGFIAAYHALGFIALWSMHVQVVLFFAVLGKTDPIYNQSEFDQLISKAYCSTDDVPARTVGSPGNRVDNTA